MAKKRAKRAKSTKSTAPAPASKLSAADHGKLAESRRVNGAEPPQPSAGETFEELQMKHFGARPAEAVE